LPNDLTARHATLIAPFNLCPAGRRSLSKVDESVISNLERKAALSCYDWSILKKVFAVAKQDLSTGLTAP
jgi:hypothetical protein